jgi:hypothetical protein
MGYHNRSSVLVPGLAGMPNAAGSTAAQRFDRQLKFVSGLERFAGPAVPSQAVRAVAFETPYHRTRVRAYDLQYDESVRARELVIPHDADQLDRMFLIEHRNGVMPVRRATRRDNPDACNEGYEIGSHGIMPS